jgi:hypothetical protein
MHAQSLLQACQRFAVELALREPQRALLIEVGSHFGVQGGVGDTHAQR